LGRYWYCQFPLLLQSTDIPNRRREVNLVSREQQRFRFFPDNINKLQQLFLCPCARFSFEACCPNPVFSLAFSDPKPAETLGNQGRGILPSHLGLFSRLFPVSSDYPEHPHLQLGFEENHIV